MGKTRTPESGSNRPRKKSTCTMPVIPGATATGSDNIDMPLVHHAVEQEQQQQQNVPLEYSSNDPPEESPKIENVATNIETEIVKLNRDFYTNDEKIEHTKKQIESAKKLLVALMRSESTEQLLNDRNNESILSVIEQTQSTEDQKLCLSSFLRRKEADMDNLLLIGLRILKERQRILKERQRHPARTKSGIPFSRPQGKALRSGLHYVEEIFRIEYVVDNESHDIGLLEIDDDPNTLSEFRIKKNIETWGPCPELVAVWPLIPEGRRDMPDRTFLDDFLPHVPSLNRDLMENAWKSLTKKVSIWRDVESERKVQYMCLPFIELLMAAAGSLESREYFADEKISSSMTIACKTREEDEFEDKRLCIRSGAAVTLSSEWDAFAMVQMTTNDYDYEKPGKQVRPCLREIDKCTLIAAITAILVGLAINDNACHNEIAIPFAIVEGYVCSLYVATLDEWGIPRIKVVKYPEGGELSANTQSDSHVIAFSPSRSRTELFVALSILLNKFKLLMDQKNRIRYNDDFVHRVSGIKNVASYSLNNCTMKFRKKQSNEDSSSSRSTSKRGISTENDAKQAASCGGVFSKLVYPFVRGVLFTSDGLVDTDSKEMKSPFYFLADWTPSSNGNTATPKRVFLKVWKVEDVDLDGVQSEFENHQQAYKAGVSVAPPVLDKLIRSTSSTGLEYVIFAVEYIPDYAVQDEDALILFCISFMKAVVKLHEEAGLLHCDLKPSNIIWSNQGVRLIDFGHSQQIDKAKWSRGTEGFEAPEIVNGTMPCSIKTDAFSVGATIQNVVEQMNKSMQQNHTCHAVNHVALRLQDSDATERWSLWQALYQILTIPEND